MLVTFGQTAKSLMPTSLGNMIFKCFPRLAQKTDDLGRWRITPPAFKSWHLGEFGTRQIREVDIIEFVFRVDCRELHLDRLFERHLEINRPLLRFARRRQNGG